MDEEEMVEYANRSTVDEGVADGEELSAVESAVLEGNQQLQVPPWRQQLTLRALVVSFFLGIMFTIIVAKLALTTGIVVSLNPSAGFLGFFFVKVWTVALQKTGLLRQPFTPQENTVIQTCVVATSGIAFSGGFGSYLLGMSQKIAKHTVEANAAQNIKNPHIGWMMGFLFVVSFLGLLFVLPLSKIMIIDYKLIYPSGTTVAHLINSIHTPQGTKLEKKRVRLFGKFFSLSFLWGLFQWFYTAGDHCGFANFPFLGLQAYKNRFYFDFDASFVGVGMICPHLVNISGLLGGIISWGIMWPLIEKKEGDWYPANVDDKSLRGIQGYRVFILMGLILGDGMYNFFKVLYRAVTAAFVKRWVAEKEVHTDVRLRAVRGRRGRDAATAAARKRVQDDRRRTEVFLKDQVPLGVAYGGYVALAAVCVVTLPRIFPGFKWYYVVVVCTCAPVLAFCNAYCCGLTDWSLASTYGKLAIFVVGAWTSAAHGGVLAGLAACGVVVSIASTASDLMQDFKTGYLTLASRRSTFASKVVGTAMGCVISPCVFWLFYQAFDVGTPGTDYPAPFALFYRNLAILGAEGFGSSLPKHCLTLCYAFFAAAFLISFVRDVAGESTVARFLPIPTAMGIPLFYGSYIAIDMCLGSFINYVWERVDRAKAEAFGPAVASGLMCGAGIWTLPESVLSLANVKPPICMKFLSRKTNDRWDAVVSS